MAVNKYSKRAIDRTQKNILDYASDAHLNIQGTPIRCTYFSINREHFSYDKDTGEAQSAIGDDSPFRYNKIHNFIVYKLESSETSAKRAHDDQFNRSINDKKDAELYHVPALYEIIPTENDYFFFEIPGIPVRLYRVIDTERSNLSYGIGGTTLTTEMTLNKPDMIKPSQIIDDLYFTFDMINKVATFIKQEVFYEQKPFYEMVDKLSDLLNNKIESFDFSGSLLMQIARGYYIYDPYLNMFLKDTMNPLLSAPPLGNKNLLNEYKNSVWSMMKFMKDTNTIPNYTSYSIAEINDEYDIDSNNNYFNNDIRVITNKTMNDYNIILDPFEEGKPQDNQDGLLFNDVQGINDILDDDELITVVTRNSLKNNGHIKDSEHPRKKENINEVDPNPHINKKDKPESYNQHRKKNYDQVTYPELNKKDETDKAESVVIDRKRIDPYIPKEEYEHINKKEGKFDPNIKYDGDKKKDPITDRVPLRKYEKNKDDRKKKDLENIIDPHVSKKVNSTDPDYIYTEGNKKTDVTENNSDRNKEKTIKLDSTRKKDMTATIDESLHDNKDRDKADGKKVIKGKDANISSLRKKDDIERKKKDIVNDINHTDKKYNSGELYDKKGVLPEGQRKKVDITEHDTGHKKDEDKTTINIGRKKLIPTDNTSDRINTKDGIKKDDKRDSLQEPLVNEIDRNKKQLVDSDHKKTDITDHDLSYNKKPEDKTAINDGRKKSIVTDTTSDRISKKDGDSKKYSKKESLQNPDEKDITRNKKDEDYNRKKTDVTDNDGNHIDKKYNSWGLYDKKGILPEDQRNKVDITDNTSDRINTKDGTKKDDGKRPLNIIDGIDRDKKVNEIRKKPDVENTDINHTDKKYNSGELYDKKGVLPEGQNKKVDITEHDLSIHKKDGAKKEEKRPRPIEESNETNTRDKNKKLPPDDNRKKKPVSMEVGINHTNKKFGDLYDKKGIIPEDQRKKSDITEHDLTDHKKDGKLNDVVDRKKLSEMDQSNLDARKKPEDIDRKKTEVTDTDVNLFDKKHDGLYDKKGVLPEDQRKKVDITDNSSDRVNTKDGKFNEVVDRKKLSEMEQTNLDARKKPEDVERKKSDITDTDVNLLDKKHSALYDKKGVLPEDQRKKVVEGVEEYDRVSKKEVGDKAYITNTRKKDEPVDNSNDRDQKPNPKFNEIRNDKKVSEFEGSDTDLTWRKKPEAKVINDTRKKTDIEEPVSLSDRKKPEDKTKLTDSRKKTEVTEHSIDRLHKKEDSVIYDRDSHKDKNTEVAQLITPASKIKPAVPTKPVIVDPPVINPGDKIPTKADIAQTPTLPSEPMHLILDSDKKEESVKDKTTFDKPKQAPESDKDDNKKGKGENIYESIILDSDKKEESVKEKVDYSKPKKAVDPDKIMVTKDKGEIDNKFMSTDLDRKKTKDEVLNRKKETDVFEDKTSYIERKVNKKGVIDKKLGRSSETPEIDQSELETDRGKLKDIKLDVDRKKTEVTEGVDLSYNKKDDEHVPYATDDKKEGVQNITNSYNDRDKEKDIKLDDDRKKSETTEETDSSNIRKEDYSNLQEGDKKKTEITEDITKKYDGKKGILENERKKSDITTEEENKLKFNENKDVTDRPEGTIESEILGRDKDPKPKVRYATDKEMLEAEEKTLADRKKDEDYSYPTSSKKKKESYSEDIDVAVSWICKQRRSSSSLYQPADDGGFIPLNIYLDKDELGTDYVIYNNNSTGEERAHNSSMIVLNKDRKPYKALYVHNDPKGILEDEWQKKAYLGMFILVPMYTDKDGEYYFLVGGKKYKGIDKGAEVFGEVVYETDSFGSLSADDNAYHEADETPDHHLPIHPVTGDKDVVMQSGKVVHEFVGAVAPTTPGEETNEPDDDDVVEWKPSQDKLTKVDSNGDVIFYGGMYYIDSRDKHGVILDKELKPYRIFQTIKGMGGYNKFPKEDQDKFLLHNGFMSIALIPLYVEDDGTYFYNINGEQYKGADCGAEITGSVNYLKFDLEGSKNELDITLQSIDYNKNIIIDPTADVTKHKKLEPLDTATDKVTYKEWKVKQTQTK